MSKDEPYLPSERDYLEVNQKIVKSYSKDKRDYTKLPDNVRDPIVSNNIATWEFDNTSKDMEENDIFS
ncbi:hypothetical protein BD780_003300 [Clostridium tetanomorphum]|uniref:Uncharacterized protein n=1 Tax=Clostridium tetanomorphum TaxID=1553 RepID=A0A923J1R8_CLOTT|nr:hypothetical protein [Clostridium tetanomorphum]KAJ51740.1 hypothetical protein CTM_11585 [Clostridium tetanomorphum DSM 665]MBC2399084.1 hypothetical protein [Clostridium tetanomorphum]MBP1865894.1 hypothetical protein [Clostridium tetanomorphum]NRS86075.1 hypothetical protein [Clostridium tetanomorphum]NRZ95903.1 hypothetical protein [Clostridium tetanomorphum]